MNTNVLVLDDDPNSRQSLAGSLRACGLHVTAPEGPFPNVTSLQEFAKREGVTHLLTDQRLTERRFSNFLGSSAAAALFGMKIAPVLVTAYMIQDMDRDIRPHLASIPKIIHRSRTSPRVLKSALEASEAEVHRGEVPRSRRRCRSIVRIEQIIPNRSSNGSQLKLLIRQWRKDELIGFPSSALPDFMQSFIERGKCFIAQVNIEAEDNDSVFLTDFELPPSDEQDDI